jgi:hypothetical protein
MLYAKGLFCGNGVQIKKPLREIFSKWLILKLPLKDLNLGPSD